MQGILQLFINVSSSNRYQGRNSSHTGQFSDAYFHAVSSSQAYLLRCKPYLTLLSTLNDLECYIPTTTDLPTTLYNWYV